jgi:hypothetical protein
MKLLKHTANSRILKAQLEETYSLHRKKAKVVFRNDALILDKLAVSGSLPKAYVKWLETAKKFYSVGINRPSDLQGKLSKIKRLQLDDLTAADAP